MSTHQFHTDLLSSTHRFHKRTTPFQHPKSLSSTPKNPSVSPFPQFHTKNSSVQHQNPLSSTPKIFQFHTPQFNTKTPSVLHQKSFSSTHSSVQHSFCLRGVLNWEVFSVEPRVWNSGVFRVGLRDFGAWKGVAVLCETDELNWGGCGTEGDPKKYFLERFFIQDLSEMSHFYIRNYFWVRELQRFWDFVTCWHIFVT